VAFTIGQTVYVSRAFGALALILNSSLCSVTMRCYVELNVGNSTKNVGNRFRY
jgi:hypothetical protein